ncbi:MAG TPA: ABC transporter permease [Actinomycetes bacterium]|nr:ABC transporter permease [Actinomycetes bacterium]
MSTQTRTGSRPATGPLLLRQVRHQNKLFLRNPFSAFFSLAFPLMFLLLLGSLNSGQTLEARGGIPYIQFLTPGLLAFAVVSTCYTGLVTGVAMNRDMGILKRVRGTPLPASVYVAARMLSSVWFSVVSAVLMVGVGVVLFDLEVVWRMLPAAVGTLLLGAACFCALGMAVAALVPNGEAAPAVANFTVLPVVFISDLFFPMDAAPAWLRALGSVFPVKHFALALEATFNPLVTGSGWSWGHLAVVALWGLAGVLVAVRKFQWEPRSPGGSRRRRRR